jgi:hypothetical protein
VVRRGGRAVGTRTSNSYIRMADSKKDISAAIRADSRQSLTDSLFQGGGYRRPHEAFSCIPESRKAGTESFLKIIAATHRFTRGRRPRRARKGWQQPGG